MATLILRDRRLCRRARSSLTTSAKNSTETTKAAGHLAVAEALKARLAKITLPAAYLALGRDICSGCRFRSEYPELFARIERLQAEITRLTTGREGNAGGTLAERARQTASKLTDSAQAKALSVNLDSLMRQLGEVGFADHGEKSGPESFYYPINEYLTKIEVADEEIRQQSALSQGRWITPRRILFGGIGALGLVVLLTVFSRPEPSGEVTKDPTPESQIHIRDTFNKVQKACGILAESLRSE